MKDVRLLTEPFIPGQLVGPFTNAHPGLGGVCTFVGEVRGGDGVEALARFELMGILIAHRVGEMRPGEPIVLVSAAARHRRAAIQAVDFAMDHLKSDAWFWKRERRGGEWRWIDPRPEDHADLARWG